VPWWFKSKKPWCLGGSNQKSLGALVVQIGSWCLGGSKDFVRLVVLFVFLVVSFMCF
jgi:hypothetical protein